MVLNYMDKGGGLRVWNSRVGVTMVATKEASCHPTFRIEDTEEQLHPYPSQQYGGDGDGKGHEGES